VPSGPLTKATSAHLGDASWSPSGHWPRGAGAVLEWYQLVPITPRVALTTLPRTVTV